MAALRSRAAANNAGWCDVVSRSHGCETKFDGDAWTSRTRTPPYYPDAVTLVPDPAVPELLARIDASAGCSIKDSFASIDLTAFGFRVLFQAEWIVRTTKVLEPTLSGPSWEVVREPDAFVRWERAWRGEDGPPGVLGKDLLDDDSVTVLAARVGDRVVGGAILYRGSEMVGVSNFFADAAAPPASWAGCLALADSLFPGSVLVGYESGAALAAAQDQGFQSEGPLRVWLRDD